MRKFISASLFFLSLSAAVSAQSAGFNCAQATTPQEKAICASPELRQADAGMTAAYRAWLAAAPPDWQGGIRQNQRLWLRLRDCTGKDQTQCLLDAEKQRTEALRSMVTRRNGILFVWRALTFTAPDSPDAAADERKYNRRDFGYVNITWPQAVSSAPEWVAWNQAMTDAATRTSGNPAKSWTQQDAADTDAETRTALNAASDTLASVSIESSYYNHGAAHGGMDTVNLNWLLKARRKLEPSDVFRPQIYWLGQLYTRADSYLHSQLDQQPGDNYQTFNGAPQTANTLRKLLADPANWQMDGKGITIAFPQYAVAPYCCTPPPFTMTWQSLQPLLNPSFPIPQ